MRTAILLILPFAAFPFGHQQALAPLRLFDCCSRLGSLALVRSCSFATLDKRVKKSAPGVDGRTIQLSVDIFSFSLFFFCGLPYLFTLSSSRYALLLGLAWRWADECDIGPGPLFFIFWFLC